jgi:hypothetical protein
MYKYYVLGHYPSSHLCLNCRPVYILKHNVSETGFYLRLQVKPTPEDGDRIQFPKRCVLKYKQDDILDKSRDDG